MSTYRTLREANVRRDHSNNPLRFNRTRADADDEKEAAGWWRCRRSLGLERSLAEAHQCAVMLA